MRDKIEIKDKTTPHDTLKVSPFRKHIRKTSPHKHNSYFEIIYLTTGEGTHTIDLKKIALKPNIIFTVRQEQIHYWDIKTEPSGFVLIIKKQFVDNCSDKTIKLLISQLSSFSCLYSNDKLIEPLFDILTSECQLNKSKNSPVIEGLLKALLGKLLECTPFDENIKINSENYFERFKELLNQEKGLTNKVAHYALLLNTTPQNLNAICRKEAKQSASKIISDHIISEAKRLLIYTDLTVSEISHQLDFKDNSHFTKYFKKQTFSTPISFRKSSL